MTTLQEIKEAKALGKKLRLAREARGHNLTVLASQCGMSVVQLVALEAGNYFAFHGNLEEMLINAATYANALEVRVSEPTSLVPHSLTQSANAEMYIPPFLRKAQQY